MTEGGKGRQEELLDGRRGAMRGVEVLVLNGCKLDGQDAAGREYRLAVFKEAGSDAAEFQEMILPVRDW